MFEDVYEEYDSVETPSVFLMNNDSVVLFLGFVKGTEKHCIKILTDKGEVFLEATRPFFHKVVQNYGKPREIRDYDLEKLECYLDFKAIRDNSPEYFI